MTLLLGTGTASLLSLIYAIYVGRVLGPEKYSAFTAALSLFYVLSIVAVPVNTTVTQFSARYAGKHEYGKIVALVRALFRRVVAIGLVAILIGILVSQPVSQFLRLDYLTLFGVYGAVFLMLLVSVLRGSLRGLLSFGRYNASLVLEAAVRLVAGIGLLALASSAAAGIAAYSVALLAAFLLALMQLVRLLSAYHPEQVDGSAVKHFATGTLIFALAAAGLQNVDMLIVKHYFSSFDAGLYGAAVTVGRSVALLAIPFHLLALPILARRGGESGSTLPRICSYYVAIAAPVVLAFWLWPTLVGHLYGAGFSSSGDILPLLGTAFFFSALAVLILQAQLATSNFGFLYAYLAVFVGQVLLLSIWHPSLQAVATIVLVSQVVATALSGFWAWPRLRAGGAA